MAYHGLVIFLKKLAMLPMDRISGVLLNGAMVPWFRYNMCPKLVPAMMQTMLRVLAKQVETHSTIGWMLERLLGKKLGKRLLVVHSCAQFLAEMWPFCDRRHRVSPHVVNVNLFPGHTCAAKGCLQCDICLAFPAFN
jgi:hypothetical protein